VILNLKPTVLVKRLLGSEGIIGIGYCIINTNKHGFIVVGGIFKFDKGNQGFILKLSKEDDLDKLERVLCLIKKDIESLEGDICFFKSNSKIQNKELERFKQNLLKLAPKLTIHDSARSPYVDISQTDNGCCLNKGCDKRVSPED